MNSSKYCIVEGMEKPKYCHFCPLAMHIEMVGNIHCGINPRIVVTDTKLVPPPDNCPIKEYKG